MTDSAKSNGNTFIMKKNSPVHRIQSSHLTSFESQFVMLFDNHNPAGTPSANLKTKLALCVRFSPYIKSTCKYYINATCQSNYCSFF